MEQYDAIVPAAFGAVGIQTKDDFLIGISLLVGSHAEKRSSDIFTQSVVSQVARYLKAPHNHMQVPFAVSGTHFQKRVWQAIAAIPSGKVLTYSELAAKVGSGPRAVANACGANHIPLFVPCHRVVAKNGLGGFMQGTEGGLAIKQWLLSHEKTHA
ncbi:cysteine methyltransferase [Methylovorus sp. MM2]|uniref:methylated-DNA--[protein]-cysteine S-methyltransferase n=1 Tax=Methylovorus sp. MM2 TaxID=1848038 RepID=UPI0007E237A0|nr:methylated-DNA--[protein]-cysteine S-methyltransferase [Methylovorus sp. MM2]OAM52261.1 cysteine methyltransferase [Methylovorus sp. MM2]